MGKRCWYYSSNGEPINGGCRRYKMDQCSFVHPGEPGWDIQPGPAGRSFTSRKQDKDNWGSGGSGWGDGPSSGWGEPSKSGQGNSSWNEAEVTGWGNANSSTMKTGDQSKSDRPSATSGWASAGATDGWGNAGATDGWGNAGATEGWGNAGATEGWGDAGTGGSTWGEPWDKSSNDEKGASEGGVWEKGEWGAPAAEAPKPTIPAKRELPRAEEPFKDSHWEPPKPVPAISHLHSDKEDEIAVPTAASDEPEDLLDDGLKGLDITTSSSGLTKMFTLNLINAVRSSQKLSELQKSRKEQDALHRSAFARSASAGGLAAARFAKLSQDHEKEVSAAEKEMKKAVQDAMDIIHPLHKSTHTSEEDFASQLHELEEDLKGLRQDVDHMKVSDPTETLATRFQNLEDRVATLGKARIATFNALRSSAPQLPSVAGILPASAPMTGLENSDKDLEKMLERSTEFTEQLKAIRRDHSQLKNTVKELETQKLSLETEQKELEVKYQGYEEQCRSAQEAMQRNATSIEQMRRKIEDLYAQPPVAPPTLASLREIYLPEMLSQVRQDMRDSIGELHRGVSRHLAEQQKQLSQQVWYNLQPATRIVELAHRFVELENVRSKGRGRAHSTGP